MRHDKLQNQLELILMLTENEQWSVEEICEELEISKRNLYYYIEFFKKNKEIGLSKRGKYYRIPRNSPFISKLCDIVKFTEDEAIIMRRLLAVADGNDLQIRTLRRKLDRYYDFNIIESNPVRIRQANIAKKLYQAIKEERKVKIIGYSSPHSQSVSDRIVEPFLLMNGSNDLRAYELSSKMNKTFRLSRMDSIEILNEGWENKNQHREIFTDLFNFASENLIHVRLRLDQLSKNVLLEEYPRSESFLDGDIVDMNVCSLLGVGRFVLGLYDHIDIIDSPELEEYVKEKITAFYNSRSRKA